MDNTLHMQLMLIQNTLDAKVKWMYPISIYIDMG